MNRWSATKSLTDARITTATGQDPTGINRLRSAGLRVTSQRRAVLEALTQLRHATIEELFASLQPAHPDLSLSTIYRTLEVLDEAGLVTHAHLHHGAPTWHSVDAKPHAHLVCTQCGSVESLPAAVVAPLASQVSHRSGFAIDMTHLVMHGHCRACAGKISSQQDVD